MTVPSSGEVPRALTARPWLRAGGALLEGVVWDAASDRLLLVDIPRGTVLTVGIGPDGAPADVRRSHLPAPVTSVHPTTRPGTLLIADGDGMALLDAADAVERLADPLAGRPDFRMNDGGVDPEGRYFAGSMTYATAPGAACLYRLDPDRTLHTVLTGVSISNGIDWSPDRTLCYYVDTPLDRVDVFDYDRATGTLTGRRPFADTAALPGTPDGLTVDAEGFVWVAFWGGGQVVRFAPDGRVDATLAVAAARVTSCAFGGPARDVLFVTTAAEGLSPAELAAQPDAGSVFVADPGVRGLPPTLFPVPA